MLASRRGRPLARSSPSADAPSRPHCRRGRQARRWRTHMNGRAGDYVSHPRHAPHAPAPVPGVQGLRRSGPRTGQALRGLHEPSVGPLHARGVRGHGSARRPGGDAGMAALSRGGVQVRHVARAVAVRAARVRRPTTTTGRVGRAPFRGRALPWQAVSPASARRRGRLDSGSWTVLGASSTGCRSCSRPAASSTSSRARRTRTRSGRSATRPRRRAAERASGA